MLPFDYFHFCQSSVATLRSAPRFAQAQINSITFPKRGRIRGVYIGARTSLPRLNHPRQLAVRVEEAPQLTENWTMISSTIRDIFLYIRSICSYRLILIHNLLMKISFCQYSFHGTIDMLVHQSWLRNWRHENLETNCSFPIDIINIFCY